MSKSSSLVSKYRKDLLELYKCAIDSVSPIRLIKDIVKIRDKTLTITNLVTHQADVSLDLSDSNIHVIGGGKCVLSMACGLAEVTNQAGLANLCSGGLLSLPIGLKPTYENDARTKDLLDSIGIECMFGAENNLPDLDSVGATRTLLEKVSSACSEDRILGRNPLFIVLLSGGGSACLTSPRYVDLDRKLELSRVLVQQGADIVELNQVRQCLSNVKGGQLAKHILSGHDDSRILSLIISDVIGDPIEYIASGPTSISADNDHKLDRMFDILRKHDCPGSQELRTKVGSCSEARSDFCTRTVINRVIGNNTKAIEAVSDLARSWGYEVCNLGSNLQGSSHDVVDKIVNAGRELSSLGTRRALVVGGGEVTINKLANESWGKGGRAQEMALDYLLMISQRKVDRNSSDLDTDMFLAGGTDGQDGPTGKAGCIVSLKQWIHEGWRASNVDEMKRAKASHDSYNFWQRHKPEWQIETGLTGTNVMDLYMYLIARE